MSWDNIWESVFRSRSWGKYPGEELVRFVASNFYDKVRTNVKILELGCGPGANMWYLANEGFPVYGIEGSEAAVGEAVKRLNAEVPKWEGSIIQGDFSKKLPFPDGEFDAVLDNEAVYCNDYATSKNIYNEANRVLKPDGKLFVRTFSDKCVGYGTGVEIGYNAFNVTQGPMSGLGFTRFTSKTDLDDLLAGYAVESIDLVCRTSGGLSSGFIEEWIVVAVK